jgi:hypothetical protein
MKSIITIIGSCCLLTLFTGCASMICGPQQSVSINTRPNHSEVMIYDSRGEIIYKNTTPCVAKLDRRSPDYLESASYVILVKREGYAPVQIPLSGSVNRAYLANILFGGLGLIIDPLTGSMWTLSPSNIDPKLAPDNTAFFSHDQGLMICLKEEVPQELVSYLEPVK